MPADSDKPARLAHRADATVVQADVKTDVKSDKLLTTTEIRAQLEARQRDIQRHLDGIRHELTTVADVTVAGRPVLDHIRARPLRAVGAAAGFGLGTSLLLGAASRLRRRAAEEPENVATLRLLTASLLDEAAHRVAGGEKTERALRKAARGQGLTVQYAPQPTPAKGVIRDSLDLAVKTAIGFGIKAGLDLLSKKLTGRPEVFTATKKAAEGAPPVSEEAGAAGA